MGGNMRSVALLAFAICGAHALAKPPAFIANAMGKYQDIMAKVPEAKLLAGDLVAQALGGERRDTGLTPQQCSQVNSISVGQLKQADSSMTAPDSCYTPVLDLVKTMCTSACQNSPMFNGGSSNRRLLVGIGTDSPGSPSSACNDPCFQPFMSGMIKAMTAMSNSECANAFGSNRRSSGRKLLGGQSMSSSDQAKMEMVFGMLCTKNANGAYCMDQIEQMDRMEADGNSALDSACASNCTQTTGASVGSVCNQTLCPECDNNVSLPACKTCATNNGGCGACVDCYVANADQCPMADNEKQFIQGLGCCFGTIFAMAGIADESSTAESADPAAIANELAACGITVSTTPCAMPGIEQTEVKAVTKLAGVTVAQFDSAAQTAFKSAMATTADVTANKVIISGFSATTVRRSTGLEVDSQILLTGNAVSSASSVQTRMQDSTALATNLQSSGASTSFLLPQWLARVP